MYPNILSLSDQIQKFENQIFTIPQSFVTIDQRFLGGGIKIQDLIQQNNFIITQIKKFKNVFHNYCILNNKIYKKIIQHQLSYNQYLNKIKSISNSIDQKISSSNLNIQTFKNQIISNNLFFQSQTKSTINKFQQQLKNKVSTDTLIQKIHQTIQRYQQSPQQLPNTTTISLTTQPELQPIKKRKGLLEDIQHIKSKISPLIEQVNQKVQAQNTQLTSCTSLLSSLQTRFTTLQQQSTQCTVNLLKTSQQLSKLQLHINTQNSKLYDFIYSLTNQKTWKNKLDQFYSKKIIPLTQTLQHQFKQHLQQTQQHLQSHLNTHYHTINKQLHSLQQKHIQTQHTLTIINKSIQSHTTTLSDHHLTFQHLDKKHQKIHKSLQIQHTISSQKFNKNIQDLNKKILQIVNTTEQLVMKKCQHKINKEIKIIKNDHVQAIKKMNQINSNLKINQQHIDFLKDLISTKANFTDLLMYFDKKVDKQSFKQLQQLINQIPQPSNNISALLHHSQPPKNQNHRRKSQDHRYRNSVFPKKTSNHFNPTKLQDNQNKYSVNQQLQLSQPMGKSNKNQQKNLSMTLNLKHHTKILRPNTAYTTLFA